MKRSSPLLILVALTLATLSYGGKQARDRQLAEAPPPSPFNSMDRAPASGAKKPPVLSTQKSTQDPVVIAEFPPLEIEEIH